MVEWKGPCLAAASRLSRRKSNAYVEGVGCVGISIGQFAHNNRLYIVDQEQRYWKLSAKL